MADPITLLFVGAAIGLIVGMLGGGGGVLAVPLLVAVGEPVLVASTLSLVVVASAAMAALVPHHRAGRVDWRVGLLFGALGGVGAVVGARLARDAPAWLLLTGLTALLVVGAVLMLRAASAARRSGTSRRPDPPAMAGGAVAPDLFRSDALDEVPRPKVVALASSVGLLTGLFGVGAGFVVVPALVSAMRLPVKRATATALVVIVMNSGVALLVRRGSMAGMSTSAALAVTSAAFAVVGALLSRRVPGWALSAAFGILMIGVAGFTVSRAIGA